jgi:hypothetical protein
MSRKPLIVEVVKSPVAKRHPQFPRVMWADYDPSMPKSVSVALYQNKADQRMTRVDLEPIRVLVIALDNDGQAPICDAIDVLNRCAEQGHQLANRSSKS